MPRNASGVYSKPAGTTAVTLTTISSTAYNTLADDEAVALTGSLARDGSGGMLADLAMGSNQITGLLDGSLPTDAATVLQAQSALPMQAVTVGGTADATTLVFAPPFTAYTAGMKIRWTAVGANTTSTPTLTVDALSPKTLKTWNATGLELGYIVGSNHICEAVYNGTDFILLNPGEQIYFPVACSDETTAILSGNGKVTFRNVPRTITLTAVYGSLTTAQTSGATFTVDINEEGTSILSTKLTFDNGEKTTATASIQPVLSDVSIAANAEMTVDIDAIGDGTAKGLKIMLVGYFT